MPVALGTMALYAFLVTAITARYTKLLPAGLWLTIHRLALVVLGPGLAPRRPRRHRLGRPRLRSMSATGLAVVAAGSYRYWASRQRRPTFTTSLPEVTS